MVRNKLREPQGIFLVLATLFIGISVFLMPINRVPDEMNHARMAWNSIFVRTDTSFDWMNSVSADTEINKSEYKQLFTEKIDLSEEKFQPSFELKRIMHIPQVLGMILGSIVYPSIGVMVTLGRLFNAVFYIASMYLIITKTRYGKWSMVLLSLLPIMVQQAGSLSYDATNFVAILGFFAFLSLMIENPQINLKKLFQILLFALALYITKSNNFLFLLLLFPINFILAGKLSPLEKVNQHIRKLIFKYKYILIVLLLVLGGLVGIKMFGGIQGIKELLLVLVRTLFNNNLNGHLNSILTVGMFGYIGLFSVEIPLWIIFIDVALLAFISALDSDFEIKKIFGFSSLAIIVIQILAIIAGMYYAWTPLVLGENAIISVGAQGRYFTPFLIFLVPFFISLKDSIKVEMSEKLLRFAIILTLVFNFIVSTGLVLDTYWFL
ncbi:DUF2142 domain-containing protein [Enterococcus casseliflavus]|uniref:DUF2142 domain-containing protein n=1 Tax=Enterococcus casseliflavus TaxID=37734 RepID=UPI000EAEF204|nr:DUF2142 domain-containing protein [Enterococcus casseliflavus]AYJ45371.1 DUF2142 domain-containing protein [Enterococcus casseliflavus]MBS5815089.1 DUF2142 domain-containing protein [Enterococcus casseliflavus]MCD4961364.1 DUF2142 domain-containing protein [Enterococcus casseliflavus]MDU3373979.1 DUF2142 domain-containing protein [Enterococcus casseliflavus]